jgi:hypothetical protein
MLNITNSPFNLVKYHLSRDAVSYKNLLCKKRVDDIEELKELLLESVNYSEQGLVPFQSLIYYTGTKVLPDNYIQSEYNNMYLVVEKIEKWNKFKGREFREKIKFFNVNPLQYQHMLNGLKGSMEPSSFAYFWSEYCIGKFNSNPYKWYNEARYLLCLFSTTRKLYTKEDLDCLYNNLSDLVKPYLRNIFSPKGKQYILQMSTNDKYVVFVGSKKSIVQSYIERLKPSKLEAYMIFREAFIERKIRLEEGVIILDYLLNKKEELESSKIRNLFGIH